MPASLACAAPRCGGGTLAKCWNRLIARSSFQLQLQLQLGVQLQLPGKLQLWNGGWSSGVSC